jgi:hypothetical protein
MIVGLAVLLWGTGLPTSFHKVEAAAIVNASDTLSNSAPGQTSVHTIAFNTATTVLNSQVITVDFPTDGIDFDLSTLSTTSISITIGGVATGTSGVATANNWGVIRGSDFVQFTNCTTAIACDVATTSQIVFTIGSEVGTMITNPGGPGATTSYEISIGNTSESASSTIVDGGAVRVAIIDEVTVSASVDTSLTFSVTGVVSGQTVNGSPTSTAATTTPTTLPFGSLALNTSKTLAHDLVVATNATNGYTVTVEQTGDLQSSTGATIDGFIDGAYTTTPTAWQGPGANVNDDSTYGHWGLTSTDGTTTRSSEFGSDQWVSASTTPVVIMGHTGPADGVTAGVGTARIGFQVQISALQEAGDDYNSTLRYIVTPTF